MEKIVNLSKTIRNNWKKSAFGAVLFYYGGATAKEKYDINILMRAACKEAAVYGDALIPMERNPTLVTVILNPVANKRKAKKEFEQYCEPLLHLAGLQVDVIQTTSEGQAKELVETLRGTEAIIVAGGDGTVSETVTGLLRRNDDANQFPLGVLPLGRTNSLANTLFRNGKGVKKVKQLIQASMAIIKGNTVLKDAMKIEPITQENEEVSRPVYALSSLEWGAFRDVEAKKDKYWIYGGLREYASYIFNGYKDSITWNCSGIIKYTPPCSGCSNCVSKKLEVKSKWSFFLPTAETQTQLSPSNVVNPECQSIKELCFKTCDFQIRSPNIETGKDDLPGLSVLLGKPKYSYTEFVSEGWNRIKGHGSPQNLIQARTVELLPKIEEPLSDKEYIFQIDNEDFEVKPVKITLLPKIIKLFSNVCKSNDV